MTGQIEIKREERWWSIKQGETFQLIPLSAEARPGRAKRVVRDRLDTDDDIVVIDE